MNLLELFKQLSLGEFSNLALANDGDGTIKPAEQAKVIMHTNTALKRLYSRFVLSEKQIIVQTMPAKTTYHLHPIHAHSQLAEDNTEPCFILDHVDEPFTGDIVRILDCQDSFGRFLTINSKNDLHSVHTPKPDVLQIPHPYEGQAIGVIYQARHPELIEGDLEQEIEIPDELEEALKYLIAARLYAGMNTKDASYAAQGYETKYEQRAREIEEQDLFLGTRAHVGAKFQRNGWV